MKILQVRLTTEDKPIQLPEEGETNDIELYRKQIRCKYKKLITEHMTEYFKPCVLLTYKKN